MKEYVFSPAFDAEKIQKPYSEDAFFISDNLFAVIDGVAGITNRRIIKKYNTDTEWFVDTVKNGFRNAITRRDSYKPRELDDPKKLLKIVSEFVIKNFKEDGNLYGDLRRYELPSANLMLAMKLLRDKDNSRFVFVHLGAGMIMFKTKDNGFYYSKSDVALERYDTEVEMMIRTLIVKGKTTDEIRDAVVKFAKMIRHAKNKDDSYISFDISYDYLKHKDFVVSERSLKAGDRILMASRGFLSFSDVFKKMSYEALFDRAFSGSLHRIVEDIRKEEKWDYSCEISNRPKPSSDISAIAIEVKED